MARYNQITRFVAACAMAMPTVHKRTIWAAGAPPEARAMK